jgi:hypothetical protein
MGTGHLPGRTVRDDRATIGAARAAFDRLDVFEQLAGAYLAAQPDRRLVDPEPPPSPGSVALQTALERWDVQVHHTLLGRPELPDLVRAGRIQALIAATTGSSPAGPPPPAPPSPSRRDASR